MPFNQGDRGGAGNPPNGQGHRTAYLWEQVWHISQKVAVVVEHFLENVQPLLQGHAKAMVVVGSRQEAVRWQLAMKKYIQENGYKLDALVAFSGEVAGPENLDEPVSEHSTRLNPYLKGRDMREAFATDSSSDSCPCLTSGASVKGWICRRWC